MMDSLSFYTITCDYHDQFYYAYSSDEARYVYQSRYAVDPLTVHGSNLEFEPSVSVTVPRGERVEFDVLKANTGHAVEFQPFATRNKTLDLVSPHQNVRMGFPGGDLEVFVGNQAVVEIDGVVNSDTMFDDKFDVVLDLRSVLGTTAVILLSKFEGTSLYSKRFIFKAIGTLVAVSLPRNYWIGLIIRATHKGIVNEANDILTYSVTARVVLGSGFASWLIPAQPLPGATVARIDEPADDTSTASWEEV